MRIAIKYSMDDVQSAIVHAINFDLADTRSKAKPIARFAFMAEFPDNFSRSFPIQLFLQVCSIEYHPTADDLRPLMAHPALVALVMQCREGLNNPSKAIWSGSSSRRMVEWLGEQFKRLGFKLSW